ncbi:MAG: hypothetical protein Q8Q88_04225 [Phenylobacterium sp.]|nr:hypothetical protein [Phenylobacterium sp.]MDP3746239.1 hypothetical protein [Phenylobacterium sp.]
MHLARLPCARFAHLPTPLGALTRSGGAQGGFGYQGEMQGALA